MTKSENDRFGRNDILILSVIILTALVLRLYKIDNPLADWHSWRQADTAAVARNFERDGFNLLAPRFDDISNIQSGQYNPQGLRLVEFPLYNASFAALHKYMPLFPLEVYGRIVSIIFSLFTIGIIYYLVLKEENRIAAGFASLVFAVMPFFVYYSRVVLPDMTAISMMFISILFAYIWSFSKTKNIFILALFYSLSVLFGALALLIKPTVIFYLIVHFYLFFKKYSLSIIKKAHVYLFFFLLLTPFVLWRLWITKSPEGVPVAQWLLFEVNTSNGREPIFFRPAFFRWVFMERIGVMILGAYLTMPLLIGIIKKHKTSFFYFLGLASLLYLFTFQGGNVQHDYYQIMILPALAIFCGLGVSFFNENRRLYNNYVTTIAILAFVLAGSFLFSYYKVKDFYSYNGETLEIAKVINTITEPGSIIVTDNVGDTTLLYLSDRKGYPAVTEDLEALKNRGAQYFVTGRSDVAEQNKKKFEIVFESDKVFIFKL